MSRLQPASPAHGKPDFQLPPEENKFHRWPKSLELISPLVFLFRITINQFGEFSSRRFQESFIASDRIKLACSLGRRTVMFWNYLISSWMSSPVMIKNNLNRPTPTDLHRRPSSSSVHFIPATVKTPNLQCKYANSLQLMKVYITATCRRVWFAYSNSAGWKVAFHLRGYINHIAGGVMCICNSILFTTCLHYPFLSLSGL